ncbi:hypothetical protein C1H84_16225 [Glutamicibacter soli]|uniref:Uncharacterized protein n=2 Tax=Glutamicibacter soli TaxID=453836 RepID=A0A365Y984_9MICC|nr:hypothetical protein C1H84_16225 [Glutamicibacter soli]
MSPNPEVIARMNEVASKIDHCEIDNYAVVSPLALARYLSELLTARGWRQYDSGDRTAIFHVTDKGSRRVSLAAFTPDIGTCAITLLRAYLDGTTEGTAARRRASSTYRALTNRAPGAAGYIRDLAYRVRDRLGELTQAEYEACLNSREKSSDTATRRDYYRDRRQRINELDEAAVREYLPGWLAKFRGGQRIELP